MKVLYEILVPTRYDNGKPIRTRHHKQWDKYVQSITGGLTIYAVGKGKWLHNGVEYPERIIPVRVMCEELEITPNFDDAFEDSKHDTCQIDQIIHFTLRHYRQKAVMYYVVSNKIQIKYAKPDS